MRNFLITIEGKQYEVSVEEISSNGTVTPVVTAAEPAKAAAPAAPVQAAKPAVKAATGAGTEMKTPMPGLIVGFKVAEGATVKKGDVVIVLEAMKMENDLIAPADGVISFTVQKGANVETGDVIAIVR